MPGKDSAIDEHAIVCLPDGQCPVPLRALRALYLRQASPGGAEGPPSTTTTNSPQSTAGDATGRPLHILVTGGAGFVGSHLVDRLMLLGHRVTVVDNFQTGRRENIAHWIGHERFVLLTGDIVEALPEELWAADAEPLDQIYHLACPASPPRYQADPIRTVKTCVTGTINVLELARRHCATFLLSSTSEIYGDPEVHPQDEDYRGCVNPIGRRACYDEGKRCAETLTYCYQRQHGLAVRVARIFNTFGPRMDPQDGRVVSNFICQGLQGVPLSVYGSGEQTRSFQYIHDLVSGLMALMASGCTLPVNLGNPEEYQINEFARIIKDLLASPSPIIHVEPVEDDPQQRKPNIERAEKVLRWRPTYQLRRGLLETIEYFRGCA